MLLKRSFVSWEVSNSTLKITFVSINQLQGSITGHVKIGDRVKIAAQSGVFNDVDDDESLMGSPAINKFKYIKNFKKIYGKKIN